MFSFVLTGTDDSKIIAQEQREVVRAEITAKLSLIDDFLVPLEDRLAQIGNEEEERDSTEKVEAAIESLSNLLSENEEQRNRLRNERREHLSMQRRAESQIIGIKELLDRYRLLDERYTSDLQRLDFIAEGSHFFDGFRIAFATFAAKTWVDRPILMMVPMLFRMLAQFTNPPKPRFPRSKDCSEICKLR